MAALRIQHRPFEPQASASRGDRTLESLFPRQAAQPALLPPAKGPKNGMPRALLRTSLNAGISRDCLRSSFLPGSASLLTKGRMRASSLHEGPLRMPGKKLGGHSFQIDESDEVAEATALLGGVETHEALVTEQPRAVVSALEGRVMELLRELEDQKGATARLERALKSAMERAGGVQRLEAQLKVAKERQAAHTWHATSTGGHVNGHAAPAEVEARLSAHVFMFRELMNERDMQREAKMRAENALAEVQMKAERALAEVRKSRDAASLQVEESGKKVRDMEKQMVEMAQARDKAAAAVTNLEAQLTQVRRDLLAKQSLLRGQREEAARAMTSMKSQLAKVKQECWERDLSMQKLEQEMVAAAAREEERAREAEALEFVKNSLKSELSQVRSDLLLKQHRLREERSLGEKSIKAMKAQLAAVKQERRQKEHSLAELETKLLQAVKMDEERAKMQDDLEEQLQQAKDKHVADAKKITEVRNELLTERSDHRATRQTAAKDSVAFKQQLTVMGRQQNEKERANVALQTKLQEAKRLEQERAEEVEALQAQLAQARVEAAAAMRELQKEISQVRSDLLNKQHLIREEREAAGRDIKAVKAQLAAVKRERDEKERDVTQLWQKVDDAVKSEAERSEEVSTLKATMTNVKAELVQVRKELLAKQAVLVEERAVAARRVEALKKQLTAVRSESQAQERVVTQLEWKLRSALDKEGTLSLQVESLQSELDTARDKAATAMKELEAQLGQVRSDLIYSDPTRFRTVGGTAALGGLQHEGSPEVASLLATVADLNAQLSEVRDDQLTTRHRLREERSAAERDMKAVKAQLAAVRREKVDSDHRMQQVEKDLQRALQVDAQRSAEMASLESALGDTKSQLSKVRDDHLSKQHLLREAKDAAARAVKALQGQLSDVKQERNQGQLMVEKLEEELVKAQRREAERAEEVKSLESTVADVQAQMTKLRDELLVKQHRLREEKEIAERSIKAVKAQLAAAKREATGNNFAVSRLELQLQESTTVADERAKAIEALQVAVEDIKEQLSKVRDEHLSKQHLLREAKDASARAVKALQGQLSEVKQERNQGQLVVEKLEEELVKAQKREAERAEEVQRLEGTIGDVQKQMTKLRDDNLIKQHRLREDKEIAERRIKAVKAQLAAAKRESTGNEFSLRRLEQQLQEATALAAQRAEEIGTLEATLETSNAQLSQVRNDHLSKQHLLREAKDAAARTVKALKAQLAAAKQDSNQGQMVVSKLAGDLLAAESREAKRAEEVESLEATVTGMHLHVSQLRDEVLIRQHRLREEKEIAERSIKAVKAQLAAAKRESTGNEFTIRRLEQTLQESTALAAQRAEELATLEGTLGDTRAQLSKVRDDHLSKQHLLREAREAAARAVKALQAQLAEVKQDRNQGQMVIEKLGKELLEAESREAQRGQEVEALEGTVAAREEQIRKMRDEILVRQHRLREQKETAEKNITTVKAQLVAAKREATGNEFSLRRLEQQLGEATQLAAKRAEEVEDLEANVNDLEAKLSQSRDDFLRKQHQLREQKEAASRAVAAVKARMAEVQREGTMRRLEGEQLEKKLDVAVRLEEQRSKEVKALEQALVETEVKLALVRDNLLHKQHQVREEREAGSRTVAALKAQIAAIRRERDERQYTVEALDERLQAAAAREEKRAEEVNVLSADKDDLNQKLAGTRDQLLHKQHALREYKETASKDRSALKAQMAALIRESNDKGYSLEKLEEGLAEAVKMQEAIAAARDAAAATVTRLEKELAQVRDNMLSKQSRLRVERESAGKDMKAMRDQLAAVKRDGVAKGNVIVELERKLVEVTQREAERSEEVRALQEELTLAREKAQAAVSNLDAQLAQIDTGMVSERKRLLVEREAAARELSTVKGQYIGAMREHAGVVEQLEKQLKVAVEMEQMRVREVENLKNLLTTARDTARTAVAGLESQLAQVRNELQSKQQRLQQEREAAFRELQAVKEQLAIVQRESSEKEQSVASLEQKLQEAEATEEQRARDVALLEAQLQLSEERHAADAATMEKTVAQLTTMWQAAISRADLVDEAVNGLEERVRGLMYERSDQQEALRRVERALAEAQGAEVGLSTSEASAPRSPTVNATHLEERALSHVVSPSEPSGADQQISEALHTVLGATPGWGTLLGATPGADTAWGTALGDESVLGGTPAYGRTPSYASTVGATPTTEAAGDAGLTPDTEEVGGVQEWQVDFCPRPLVDEGGEALWELLVCDEERQVEWAEYLPHDRANVAGLTLALQRVAEEMGAQLPKRIKFFRAHSQAIISTACQELGIRPVPSPRTLTLMRWIEERFNSEVYSKHPRFSSCAPQSPPPEAIDPEKLPASLKGERWALVSLPLSELEEEAAIVKEQGGHVDLLRLDHAGIELSGDTAVPGVCVFSSQARPIAERMQSLELGPLEADVPRAAVNLNVGVSTKWRFTTYKKNFKTDREAMAWEEAKRKCDGLHFLAVQGNDSDDIEGLWTLLDKRL